MYFYLPRYEQTLLVFGIDPLYLQSKENNLMLASEMFSIFNSISLSPSPHKIALVSLIQSQFAIHWPNWPQLLFPFQTICEQCLNITLNPSFLWWLLLCFRLSGLWCPVISLNTRIRPGFEGWWFLLLLFFYPVLMWWILKSVEFEQMGLLCIMGVQPPIIWRP